MSRRLPVVIGGDLVVALTKAGFDIRGQKGSHVHLRRDTDGRRVTVPVHAGRDIPAGTLKAILKDANISADELRELIR